MIPTQTFENFPEFANAGEKTQPNEQKYAQGFLPSDTLPAEWHNWFLGGATRGITALDTGLASVEAELNSVLMSRQESPDATKTNQLLSVLEKIKAEAILAAHPVGSLYWTSSNENPAVTFGGGTWKQIKDRFVIAAGDTYNEVNATGGSATVTLGITQIPAHTHGLNSHTHTLTPTGTVSSHNHGLNSHTHSVGAHSHGLNSHKHTLTPAGTIPDHTHGMIHHHIITPYGTISGHTHTVGAHAHGLNSHTHSVGAHAHGLNSHTHSFTPQGSVGAHSHSVGAHSHGLNSHTHSFTPQGTVSSHSHGLNSHKHSIPALSGSGTAASGGSHTHRVLVNTGSKRNEIAYKYPPNSDSSYNGVYCQIVLNGADYSYDKADNSWTSYPTHDNTSGYSRYGNWGAKNNNSYKRTLLESDGSHTHTVTVTTTAGTTGAATGNTEETAPTFSGTAGTTGAATGNTANSTAFNTGETAPTFSGTAGTTGAATGNTANSTAFNTGAASGNTANSTAFETGSTSPSFEGQNSDSTMPYRYINGDMSQGAEQIENTDSTSLAFNGIQGTTSAATGNTANSTAFNTGAASGNTANTQPTFTGTQGTTSAATGNTASTGGSNGTTQAVSIMPPYVVKYCWERTS